MSDTMTTKCHLPAPQATGLRGWALCGRTADYGTGDHAMILRMARGAKLQGDASHYCARCLARL